MRLRDISPSQHRLLRDVTSQISNKLETEFSELPGVEGPSVGIVLHERHRHVLIEIPADLLMRAAGDLTAREAIRVHIKGRRDRMLFRAPPKPLPKHIAAAATPGSMHSGFGYRRGGGPRGRR
ncbi:MAG TPA: hypothetical protein VFD84_11045 [Candidatus Binatia bacterium]|nr:hypothetical protein [Candidatus Binatia bacterium]